MEGGIRLQLQCDHNSVLAFDAGPLAYIIVDCLMPPKAVRPLLVQVPIQSSFLDAYEGG